MNTFDEELNIVYQYFPHLDHHQKKQIQQLQDLYLYWNERINVISRKDIDHLYLHHVLHSLSIAKVVSFLKDSEVLDIGTGGGFPGIPLAIIFPDTHFYLNDSIQKKIHVVKEVVKSLSLKNVSIIHDRAEKISAKFDFIVSRAVTDFPSFMKLCDKKIKSKHLHPLPNGVLYLKGGDIASIQEEMGKYYKDALVFNIYDFFPHAYFETKRIIHYGIF